MKKLLAILLVFMLIIGSFAGCSKGGGTNTSSDNTSTSEVSSENVSSEDVSSEDESSDTDTAEGEDGGDYGNGKQHTQQDLEDGLVPLLLILNGEGHQGHDAHNGQGNVRGHAGHAQQEQQDADRQHQKEKYLVLHVFIFS